MKVGFGISIALSAALSGLLLYGLDSCSHDFTVGPAGELLQSGRTVSWKEKMPEFEHLREVVRSGDSLTYSWTRVSWMTWIRKSTLTIRRSEDVSFEFRYNAHVFWFLVVGVGILPIQLWLAGTAAADLVARLRQGPT